jgi:hypothetical protein
MQIPPVVKLALDLGATDEKFIQHHQGRKSMILMSPNSTKITAAAIASVSIVTAMASIAEASSCCNGRTAVSVGGNIGAGRSFNDGRNNLVTYKPEVIAKSKQLQSQLVAAQTNFDRANDRIAAIQNRQLVASNGTLQYTNVKRELTAAKQERDRLSVELRQTRDRAKEFIQSLKNPTADLLEIKQPVW